MKSPVLALITSLMLMTPAMAQELKARDGATMEIRQGPSLQHDVIQRISGEETVHQRGRNGDWVKVDGGWVTRDSVEWKTPFRPRGEPTVSVGPTHVISSSFSLHTVSPDGSLLAINMRGREQEILVYRASTLEFVKRLDAQGAWYTSMDFVDNRTLVLSNGDLHHGIGNPTDPTLQLVIDLASGKPIHGGQQPLFGFLGRNPQDAQGRIISYFSDRILLHDPETYEIVGLFDPCSDSDICPVGAIVDATFDKSNNTISTVARVKDRVLNNDFLIVRAQSLEALEKAFLQQTWTRVSLNDDHTYYTHVPSQGILLTKESGSLKRKSGYVGSSGWAHGFHVLDIASGRNLGSFTIVSSKDIVICRDEKNIVALYDDIVFFKRRSDRSGDEVPDAQEASLAAIEVTAERSLRFSKYDALSPYGWQGAPICAASDNRAILHHSSRYMLGSAPHAELLEPKPQLSSEAFPLVVGGRMINLPSFHIPATAIDLDTFEEASVYPEGVEVPEDWRVFGITSGGEVVTSSSQLPVHFVGSRSNVRQIEDEKAKSIFLNTVRSKYSDAVLLMNGSGNLSVMDAETRTVSEIYGIDNIDELNELYGKAKYMTGGAFTNIRERGQFFVFSADGRTLFAQNRRGNKHVIEAVDARTGKKTGEHASDIECLDNVNSAALEDGTFVCYGRSGREIGIVVGNIQTGKVIKTIPHYNLFSVQGLALDDSGRFLFVRGGDGISIHSVANGEELARLFMRSATQQRREDGRLETVAPAEWLLITQEGFYAGSREADKLLQATHGVKQVYTIEKFRDSLYRPDLVSEKLRGDPEGIVAATAARISLEAILASGAAPSLSIQAERIGGRVAVTGELEDQGGGIGRFEWRVNGVVQQAGEGMARSQTELFLASGQNRIELVAYNRNNSIRSKSEQVSIEVAATEIAPPRLFILALGVDSYAMESLNLKYAVKDARTTADILQRAGQDLYEEVFTEVLADSEVTRDSVENAFRSLSTRIRPNDVFIFFAAGHGKTLDGRYFYVPQDFEMLPESGPDRIDASIRRGGIGHVQWREWFSMIPAQKSLLLFDTCESGSLAEAPFKRDLRYRAAGDLLGNATGRAVMAASSSTEIAWEGYEGHGIFTHSIMQALTSADVDGDGRIDISELASAIETTVPRIAQDIWNERQTPQFSPPQFRFDVVGSLATAQ